MFFHTDGRRLLANGYLIVPIEQGQKYPALKKWQNSRLGAEDLMRYPAHGVGIITGQGAHPIVGIDVDTSDAALAERFVEWCRVHLGDTCERVGNAPKILLAYRAAAEGWGKSTGAWLAAEWLPGPSKGYFSGGYELDGEGKPRHKAPVHRLEILGKGQQFVAYHIHPGTGRPYEWVDLCGGLSYTRADELPIVTLEQVAEAIATFERMALEAGYSVKPNSTAVMGGVTSAVDDEDFLLNYSPKVGLELSECAALLDHVDNEDYDTWLKVGMSLHHEFDGSDEAMFAWDEWSATATNYGSSDDIALRWVSFGGPGRSVTARWLLKVGNQSKRVAQRAEKREALQEIKQAIVECNDSLDLIAVVARQAGEAAAGDLALRAEFIGLIQGRFKALTKTTIGTGDVRTAMTSGQKAVAFNRQRRQNTEFGNAERMLDAYGKGLMYVPEMQLWYSWSGVHWQACSGVAIEHLAKETVLALPGEAKTIESDAERAEFFKFCAASQQARMVKNMVTLAQSDPRVVVPLCELDKHSHLLGVGNGAVDLRTGDLMTPSEESFITTITPVEYRPKAKCPLFQKIVSDVFFDDAAMVSFFKRVVGYALMGNPTEDIIVIPFGDGSNGKSTVLGAIRHVLGGHARMASAQTFLSSAMEGAGSGGPREDILRLRGARFVTVAEPEENSELRESFIKAMTGGETMPARGMYSRTTIEVMPTWVTFIATNHRPVVKGDDHGIWRRLMPIPFLRNFDEDLTITKDLQLAEKLAAESAGILRWCVEGALDYQRFGLQSPEGVIAAKKEYRDDMDLLKEFLDDVCELGDFSVKSSDLWQAWESYAGAKGELKYISTDRALGRRIAARGFTKTRNVEGARGRGFYGLRLRVENDVLE